MAGKAACPFQNTVIPSPVWRERAFFSARIRGPQRTRFSCVGVEVGARDLVFLGLHRTFRASNAFRLHNSVQRRDKCQGTSLLVPQRTAFPKLIVIPSPVWRERAFFSARIGARDLVFLQIL